MRNKLVPCTNVLRLNAAIENLLSAPPSMPRMCFVRGKSGSGKTYTIERQAASLNAVFVRATRLWTPRLMLMQICREIGMSPKPTGEMFELVVQHLNEHQRPLFIDEVNYLAEEPNKLGILENIRDLHDLANVPVVLVAHTGAEKRIAHKLQLARRLSQRVDFKPLSREDAELFAITLCEVGVASDLLDKLHHKTEGSAAYTCLGLHAIEQYAKANGLDQVDAKAWNGKQFYSPGDF
jgi:DNA transposition AAA+ family ATPase